MFALTVSPLAMVQHHRALLMLLPVAGQLSLLPSAGRNISAGQSAVTLCVWGVKAGMVHSTCG